MRWLIPCAAALVSAACATPLAPNQYTMEFRSEPSGALVYLDGQALGTTPFRTVLNAQPHLLRMDEAKTNFVPVWASGAQYVSTQTWHPKRNKTWIFNFSRPASAPRLDIDLLHAANSQALQAQQKMAKSASEQAALDSFLRGVAEAQQRRRSGSSICLTAPMGAGAVYVNCN